LVHGRGETRFTRSNGVDIAYQVVGDDAGIDVLFLPGWVSHLDVMWELGEFAAFLERLATFGRLIVFDKRGTGLSDRVPGTPTLEERAGDVEAVLDAVGCGRVAIAAWGDGAAIAAMFAATHPERVDALVLASLAVSAPSGDKSVRADPALVDALSEVIESGWGRGDLAELIAPSMAADERFRSWLARWERMSATPNAAAATLRWAMELDLGPVLPAVQAPTLILHRTGTGLFDLDATRRVAARMPNASTIELPGVDELPYIGDSDAMLAEIEQFLTGSEHVADVNRILTTVLFTDVVGSTRKAEELGDRRWRHLLEDHHARVRRLLDRYGGVEIDTAGDGFLATFDGPARAVRCAVAICDAVREIGLEVRAGLHTGEVERRDHSIAGVAVHLGARVAALAQGSEVLATSTVQMLVLGSGIRFTDRGLHTLKGISEPVQLFAVENG
jgi:class 3 adenylate cyclase